MFVKAFITLGLAAMVLARPQFLTFKDGNVGVNFGGYHASAGLGGLLTGGSAAGGLHAEAGTPWGARAGAGLGGDAGGQGGASGGLYAGATSGVGHGASASLGGSTSAEGSFGTSVVAAKGVKTVAVETPVVVEKTAVVPVETEKQVEVVQQAAPVQASAGFTFTKTVQPVAYTTVTKTVQPVVVEQRVKAVEAPKTETVQEEVHDVQVPQYYNTVYLRKRFRPRHFYKHYGFYPAQAAFYGGAVQQEVSVPAPVPLVTVQKSFVAQPVQTQVDVVKQVQPVQVVKQVHKVPVQTQVVKQYGVPAQGGFEAQGGFQVGGGSRTIFDNIFNIPIATLGAVNQLLNSKAAGASGSFQVSKQVYG